MVAPVIGIAVLEEPMKTWLALSLVAALAAPAAAQFSLFDWTEQATGGGFSGITVGDDSMSVSGPTHPDGCFGANVWGVTFAPMDALVRVKASFDPDDFGAGGDWPFYIVNGVQHSITDSCEGCEIVFEVEAGDSFGFGNHSVDCLWEAATTLFTELRVIPKPGGSSLDGNAGSELLGWSLASVGDVDFDGIPDVAVGAPRANGTNGRVLVLSGADASVLFVVLGTDPGGHFGYSVAAAGDLDGDRVPDLIVGAPFANGTGRVLLVSGAGGGTLATILGDQVGDRFGLAVDSAGDVDGDGLPDVLVGAPGADPAGADSGFARVVSGDTTAALLTLPGAAAGDQCGFAVAGAGDVNGDLVPDVVVGSPWFDAPGPTPDAGRAIVHSGADGSELLAVMGASLGSHVGSAVSPAGDVDGDTVPDFVVGAPHADGDHDSVGQAIVYSGATGDALHVVTGGRTGDQLGAAVGPAGDVDDDGRPDVIIGSPGAGWNDGSAPGTARVISGRDGSLVAYAAGGQFGAFFGSAVTTAGDLDGDGRAEVLVGAPSHDGPGGTDAGQATTFSFDAIWANLGSALAGSAGVPALSAKGLLVPDEPLTLQLVNVPTGVAAWLIVGLAPVHAPFKGGTLVPAPTILFPRVTGPTGVKLALNWPASVPAGFDLYFQFWIVDAAGPAGFSASNGLRGTTH